MGYCQVNIFIFLQKIYLLTKHRLNIAFKGVIVWNFKPFFAIYLLTLLILNSILNTTNSKNGGLVMLKIISSLEKCFLDESFASKPALKKASLLKNEVYRFGACYTFDRYLPWANRQSAKLTIDSQLKKYIKV